MAKKAERTETFTVVERLRHDGDRYLPGDDIVLTETQALHLLASKKVALPGGDTAAAALLQRQSGEFTERVKGDLEAVNAARDDAAKDLEAAKAELAKAAEEREAAAKDLEAAKAERAEAEKARDETKADAAKAAADRKAAEKAAKK